MGNIRGFGDVDWRIDHFTERPCQGGPRSLVGNLKYLVSAFCQRFTSLSEIEGHTFVLVRRLSVFHLGAVATFWPMSLVGIYPGRSSAVVSLTKSVFRWEAYSSIQGI